MKPLLAFTVSDVAQVRFPVLASPKLDGVRCIVHGGRPMTRALKPIPNEFARRLLSAYPDIDGELIAGDPTAGDVFARTQSAMMTIQGSPEFTFHVFDRPGAGTFADRLQTIAPIVAADAMGILRPVPHVLLRDPMDLAEYEAATVAAGYEGIMIRDPGGIYKHGRSTAREGLLGKVKRFEDSEARIIGVAELQHNENAAEINALGHSERSTAAAGLVAGDTLGALIVQADPWSEPFRIGTGYTAAQRAEFWADRESIVGRLVKFKYQPSGTQDAPRFPVFLGFRDLADIVTD